MKESPCIINSCLKYPACKHKKFITCTPLRQYCDDLIHTQASDKIWEILYREFPNLLGIQLEQARKDSNITNVKDLILIKKEKTSFRYIDK